MLFRAVMYCSVLTLAASARPSRVCAQNGTGSQNHPSTEDVEGKDAVLELALTTPTPPDIAEVLEAALLRGVQPAVDAYQQDVTPPSA
jgi:hypothetical protein